MSGYILDSDPRQITLKAGEDNTLYIENTAKSPLYILKTDKKTDEPVGGVKFRVEKANGELVAEVTTSSTGYAAVPQMEPGYVTVREISVPDGYTLDPIPKTILIEAGKPAILHFENEPYGSLSILKTDADGNPLAGAVFELRTTDGALVATVTSGENGLAVVPNLKGDFIVTEVKSPEGFLLDSTPHPVHMPAMKRGSCFPFPSCWPGG